MWWGRIVGSVVGIPGGAFGIAFGFLIGSLIDQLLRERTTRLRVQRFLTGTHDGRPAAGKREASRSSRRDERKALAVVGLSIYVAGADGPPTIEQIQTIRRYLTERELPGEPRRAGRAQSGTIRHLIDESIRLLRDLDVAGLSHVYAENAGPEECEELMAHLIRVAYGRSKGLSHRAAGRVRELAAALSVSGETLETLMSSEKELDAASCRVLGVSRSASAAEVKRVYRQLAAQFHPDTSHALNREQRQESEEAFLRIQRAYATLMEELGDDRGAE